MRPTRDEARLPQWAQQELKLLRHELEDWKRRALEPATADYLRQGNPRMNLVESSVPLVSDNIRYSLDDSSDRNDIEVSVGRANSKDMVLDVRSINGRLDICPIATNMIRVRVSQQY